MGYVNDHYTETEKDDPALHGTTVFWIAQYHAPESTISTFQVVGDEQHDQRGQPRGTRGDLIEALTDAIQQNVDILNLSLGIPHECNGLCNLAREIELAVEVDELTVIAATGNADERDRRQGVNCPAMLDSVIGVGGYHPVCTHDKVDPNSSQWWLEKEGEIVGTFCGQQGCCNGSSCDEYVSEEIWEGNVSFHNDVPDVVAPVMDVYGDDLNAIDIQNGTSFATPIITGLLATLLSDLNRIQEIPHPESIRNAVNHGAVEIDKGNVDKMNCQKTWDILRGN